MLHVRHLFLLLICFGFAGIHANANTPQYTENKGQWHENVLFRTESGRAIGYIDRDGFTLMMLENDFYDKLHSWVGNSAADHIGKTHTLKMKFLGADLSQEAIPGKDAGTTQNFFIGNNSSKWATNARSYDRVKIPEVYPNIDVQFGTNRNNLKYDFIVAPNANPDLIKIEFSGHNRLFIKNGALIAQTSVGDFTELAPFAYQFDAVGKIEKVACKFSLNGNIVTYKFPKGYDNSRELIIDPEIAFSSFIGSTSSSFGFTASYDDDGNLYAGAVVFGAEYPIVPGAAQIDFGDGVVDCGISKFSSSGDQLLYSTYLGGWGNESPHSIVVRDNHELYILGTTSSPDFPISTGAYQSLHKGGITTTGSGYTYENGSDIFVTKLNANGTAIIASTFIGGTSNDGLGIGVPLETNYGDKFRGEIVIDGAGNAYVASVTSSGNFPVVNGYSNSLGGLVSGVVFKLSANLQNLIWSTYTGGNFSSSAVSLQLAPDNSVYFTGGTTSTVLPTTAGAYQTSKLDGVDGYIGHISADGSQLLASTFNGTNGFDHNFFVQLDNDGFVYVVGQTTGSYPVSNGVYSNPNSGQYIQKFSPDLTTSIWSTVVGSGDGVVDFSPSAFLVTNCYQIYISGWGGAINNTGTTFSLPVTANAFQTTTDGNDFYLMVLDADASDLVYGTYFGGNQSSEHVDGGTSRFDKNGTVYQAVCAGCFGNSDFPTQPGVWSETNGSDLCNLGVMKFSLSSVNAIAEIDAPEIVCPGFEFDLVNQSIGADTFLWNMGDGFTTTDEETTYSFDEPGTYTIMLYASDSQGCLSADSTSVTVEVASLPEIEVETPEPICPGETVQLNATGTATSYLWSPATGLSSTTIANPVFSGVNSQEYTVTGSTICGTATETVNVVVGNTEVSISEDEQICPGESVQLEASGGVSYLWSPATGLSATDIANPVASPQENISYEVLITTENDCEVTEQMSITILPPAPTLQGKTEYVSCNGSAIYMNVSGAAEYSWSPAIGLNFANIANPIASPFHSMTYTVTGTNSCGTDVMEVSVLVNEIRVSIDVDSLVCYQERFTLTGSGAHSYIWQPAELFINPYANPAEAILEMSSIVSVTGFDSLGCFDSESKLLMLYPRASVSAGRDRIVNFGEGVQLESSSIYPITWESSPYLSCLECNHPYAKPPENTTFYATIISPDGCVERDSVTVNIRGNIYVPNSFTPDEDGLNDVFKAEGVDISEFKMEIFNRWGELIFVSENIDHGWNGARMGSNFYCSPDLYQYRIIARELQGNYFELNGHVTLLR